MSFIKVYIHFVWATKHRFPFLTTRELREKLWYHMKENAKTKDIHIDTINGHSDHCHCLISMGANQTIQKTMQLIKGESSLWVDRSLLPAQGFKWQEEYFAVSVCESSLARVRAYIRNQERHHSRKIFQDEYDEFILKYGFEKFNG